MRARRSDLRQALAAFGTARIDDGAAATGLHADQKPMRAGTAGLGGLVGALHGHGETRLRWLGVKGGGRRLAIGAGIEPVPQAANWPDLLPGSPVLSTLAPCSPSAQATSDAARELPVDRASAATDGLGDDAAPPDLPTLDLPCGQTPVDVCAAPAIRETIDYSKKPFSFKHLHGKPCLCGPPHTRTRPVDNHWRGRLLGVRSCPPKKTFPQGMRS